MKIRLRGEKRDEQRAATAGDEPDANGASGLSLKANKRQFLKLLATGVGLVGAAGLGQVAAPARKAEAEDGSFDNVSVGGLAGIGISASGLAARLHVKAGTGNQTTLRLQHATDQYNGIEYLDQAGAVASFVGIDNTNGSLRLNAHKTSFDLVFLTQSNEAARVRSGGNVGIGTPAPEYKLDVLTDAADGGARIAGSGAGGPWLILNAATTNASYRYTGMLLQSNGATQWQIGLRGGDGLLHLFDSGNMLDRLVITPSGSVGVGTSIPVAKLDVAGAIAVNGSVVVDGYGAALRSYYAS